MGGGIEEKIHNSDGHPNVLKAHRNDGSYVNANYDNPENQWNDNGAFAFPATHFISKSQHVLAFSFVFLIVVLQVVHTNPQAFYLSHLFFQKL